MTRTGKQASGAEPGAPRVDGVMIGYPGPDHVVTGGRGVLRARLHVHGVAGHTGSASSVTPSAIAKAAALVTRLLLSAARDAGIAAQAKVAEPSNIGRQLGPAGYASW